MTRLQFRVLYRQFLFRVVDLELLSAHAQGDATKLLGQFAALLIFFGVLLSLSVLGVGNSGLARAEILVRAWGIEHLLIATSMLVVGLFAVLSWDSVFPDRRDVFALAPLPVPVRALFLAKVAASATALSLTVLALNGLPSLAWPLALAPPNSSLMDLVLSPAIYRTFAAWWITVISAGGFLFGSVLSVQGLAALLLPRRHFLRMSALLQMAAFGLLVSTYFLQPSLATPQALLAWKNQRLLEWLPSYWFLGWFHQWNGSMHPALIPLARRAWLGSAVVACGTAVTYLLCYFRMLRKIVEEPDILPGSRGGYGLPRFGNSFVTAVTQFSIRTLLRSRQHRIILAFYMGIGFAITILFIKTPRQPMTEALLASTIVMLSAWIVGTRAVFFLPLDLRANWIFRITPLRGGGASVRARRSALFALALMPAWLSSAVLFLTAWPWKPAALHLAVLGLMGAILAELCLLGTPAIPFTCAWLPGRSNLHLTFWLCIGLLMKLISKGAEVEKRILRDPTITTVTLLVLGVVLFLARCRTAVTATSAQTELQFEANPPPTILGLGLRRDGALAIEPPPSRRAPS